MTVDVKDAIARELNADGVAPYQTLCRIAALLELPWPSADRRAASTTTERKRLSVTITGPEHNLLEAMAEVLRRSGYQVFALGKHRHHVSAPTIRVVNALRSLNDAQIEILAMHWRFARLERERRLAEGDG